MGTSRTATELANKLVAFSEDIPKANLAAAEASALVLKTSVLGQVAGAVGADLRMGKKKIGVRYQTERTNSGGQVFVKATGPMHWLERGVKPHAIVTRSAGGTRAARTQFVSAAFGGGRTSLTFGGSVGGRGLGALKFADGGFRPYARRVGRYPAKRSWSIGVKTAEPAMSTVFRTVHAKALASAFR